jgi:hypothetical protein
VLSASFVVFLVREAENRSKHVQVVSGAPLGTFWAANYAWDLLNFLVPAAGMRARMPNPDSIPIDHRHERLLCPFKHFGSAFVA